MNNKLLDLGIKLTAKNMSQDMTLSLTCDKEQSKDEFWFTLWGKYNEIEKMQVDFNEMTREELKELRDVIDIILEESDSPTTLQKENKDR